MGLILVILGLLPMSLISLGGCRRPLQNQAEAPTLHHRRIRLRRRQVLRGHRMMRTEWVERTNRESADRPARAVGALHHEAITRRR
jgi:hypothetical protein